MDMQDDDAADWLIELRGSLHLTQEGLARELGVTTSSVYRWEKGLARPSRLALAAIERLRARHGDTSGDAMLARRSP